MVERLLRRLEIDRQTDRGDLQPKLGNVARAT